MPQLGETEIDKRLFLAERDPLMRHVERWLSEPGV